MREITPHPVFRIPTPQEAMEMGRERFLAIVTQREEMIAREKADPLRYGVDPPIWRVCWALLGLPFVTEEYGAAMRAALGFKRPISTLLINGGQRGSKSEFASKTAMKMLLPEERRIWMLHSNGRMSIEYQQPLMKKYLPAELQHVEMKSRTTYLSYKMKTGFSEGRFILPWKSDCSFLTYEMDRGTVEGGNVDGIFPDELVPSDWVETMELRIAEKSGKMVITFTPVNGYTDTVKLFQDGAAVMRESVGFLCPTDGGEPDIARALGLTDEELRERVEWMDGSRKRCPSLWARPEQCDEWIFEKDRGRTVEGSGLPGFWGRGRAQPEIPAGRRFERVPRVLKCVDPDERRAVVFFHSSDNPYGNPLSVWRTIAKGARWFHRERFYGVANKLISTQFPRFDRRVHVVPHDSIPKEGTNYHFCDPCSGRNFANLWIRATPEGDWVLMEWPNQFDDVPGVGVMGPWALPSGKRMDGIAGPAQKSLGWGLAQYKREFARIEGWKEFQEWLRDGKGGDGAAELQAIRSWNERGEAQIPVFERFLDSRFAAVKTFTDDSMETLIDEFDEFGVTFHPTEGGDSKFSISEGVCLVNAALYYDQEKPVSFFNKPQLHVSEKCLNLIFALENWTGEDGQKGACKDFVDLIRYYYLKGCGYVRPDRGMVEGHGVY